MIQAFQTAVEELAAVIPNGFHERGPGGALLATTGSLIPSLNGITSVDPTPDKAEIALLCDAAEVHVQGLPWSIRLRREPEEGVVAVAADHGLTTLTRQPFMLLKPADDRVAQESARESASVRPLRNDEHEVFADVLGSAFGAPPAIITSLYTPLVLSRPFVRAYVAEVDSVPAAAGSRSSPGNMSGSHFFLRVHPAGAVVGEQEGAGVGGVGVHLSLGERPVSQGRGFGLEGDCCMHCVIQPGSLCASRAAAVHSRRIG
ncbi:hypothetical protein ABZY09_14530 [Streptomyces sp. NPDC002928]|uniref:hypothetical protein n=1 Tax=Streptomyces sp. NPDC002928 TaxID=3154440 RepID=UPI0033B63705